MFNCLFRNMNIYLCIIYKRNDIIVENIVLFFENEVNLICWWIYYFFVDLLWMLVILNIEKD